ncbi:ABC-three component system middle component 1 [Sphingobacterium daejeonense]|jgi:hypothetical protein|uniref:ABC-three component system middle component 1 n=1 Tax=Sphingobacterium daejeonense TaxID=371142 RepID=A0ABW3RP43_9SPHI
MELFKGIDSKEEIYNKIRESFNIKNVIIGNLMFGDNIPVIFIQFNDLNNLEKYWKEFNSFITAEYLMKIKNDFSKWNSYVFYLTENTVKKPLKYEVENNKFSTRKIVIESISQVVDDNMIKSILSEHIINDNIEFNVENQNIESFSKNAIINEALKSISFNKSNEIKEENLLKVLNHLEKTLSDEN